MLKAWIVKTIFDFIKGALFKSMAREVFVDVSRELAASTDNHLDDKIVEAMVRSLDDGRYAEKVSNTVQRVKPSLK